MKFGKFNKERIFTIDTSGFDYKSLGELESEYGEDTPIRLRGVYIGTKSQFDPEVPIIATDECYVNLPVHQLDEIKAMLKDPAAIRAINNGEAGFTIGTYFQKRFNKECYKAVWCDYEDEVDTEEAP